MTALFLSVKNSDISLKNSDKVRFSNQAIYRLALIRNIKLFVYLYMDLLRGNLNVEFFLQL